MGEGEGGKEKRFLTITIEVMTSFKIVLSFFGKVLSVFFGIFNVYNTRPILNRFHDCCKKLLLTQNMFQEYYRYSLGRSKYLKIGLKKESMQPL